MKDEWELAWNKTNVNKELVESFKERNKDLNKCIWEHVHSKFGGLDGLKTAELGSGLGKTSLLMALEGAEPTLYDYSETALKKAKELYNLYGVKAIFKKKNILNLKESEKFDIVMSFGLCEHFRDDDRFKIIHVHRDMLNDGGLMILNVPNKWCLPYLIQKKLLEIRGKWEYGYEQAFTKKELQKIGKKLGLKNMHFKGFKILGFYFAKYDMPVFRDYLGHWFLFFAER